MLCLKWSPSALGSWASARAAQFADEVVWSGGEGLSSVSLKIERQVHEIFAEHFDGAVAGSFLIFGPPDSPVRIAATPTPAKSSPIAAYRNINISCLGTSGRVDPVGDYAVDLSTPAGGGSSVG